MSTESRRPSFKWAFLMLALSVAMIGNLGTANAADALTSGQVVTSVHQNQQITWSTPAVRARHSKIQNTVQGRDATTVITLNDGSAPTRYDFALKLPLGASARTASDGSVAVLDQQGGVLGSFQKPWAKDADGKSLGTSYILSGSILTQVVQTAGARFPVIADPHYTWGWVSGTIYFNKAETRLMALGSGVVSWIPSPYTVWGGRTLAALAGYAAATNQCIKWKIYAVGIIGGGPLLYHGGYCT